MKNSIKPIVKSLKTLSIPLNHILAGISLNIKRSSSLVKFLLIIFQGFPAFAVTNYVWSESPSPTPPYTSWSTAARTIQDAVDAAQGGDTVLVTNGTYSSGQRVVYSTMAYRVVIDKPIVVRSVNGPKYTLIVGSPSPVATNVDGAIRCVYITRTNAMLIGFTLTNGHTRITEDYYNYVIGSGAGVFCESVICIVSNCILTKNSADWYGGGAFGGTLYNCALIGNSATRYGGGISYGVLYNCTLTGNSADYGGGSFQNTLYNCTLTGNSADIEGGGVDNGTLYNCIDYFNSAPNGPNYYNSTLYYSCAMPLPPGEGNISNDPMLLSMTHLSTNSPCIGKGSSHYAFGVDIDGENWVSPPSIGADELIIGQSTGTLKMWIEANYTNVATSFEISFMANNEGKITSSVWDFGDGTIVSNNPYVTHSYMDTGTYSVKLTGYNDSNPNGITTTITINVESFVYYVDASSENPVFPYTDWLTPARTIQDAVDASVPGSFILVSSGQYSTGGKAVHGSMTNRVTIDKPVNVMGMYGPDNTFIIGSPASNGTNGDEAIRCVYLAKGAMIFGFTITNGYTRATGMEFKEQSGGGIFCESSSSMVTNCVITKNSANNVGGGIYRGTLYDCILTGNSAKSGGGAFESIFHICKLTGNSADNYGGGARNSTIYNCLVVTNSANKYGGGASDSTLYDCKITGNLANYSGGGSYGGTLYNCVLFGNSSSDGGGSYGGTLYNCTVVRNSANLTGGGVHRSTLYNSIVYFNFAPITSNYFNSTFYYSCTAPLPPGPGNIDLNPSFADLDNEDLHLWTNSPCINSGNNIYVQTYVDFDAGVRIIADRVDLGAYESRSFYNWLQNYGLPIDGSVDHLDTDKDGLNNLAEWLCGTNPTNQLSVLRLLSSQKSSEFIVFSWQGVSGRRYRIEYSTNLFTTPAFYPLSTNIIGIDGTMTYTNAVSISPAFYRIGVE